MYSLETRFAAIWAAKRPPRVNARRRARAPLRGRADHRAGGQLSRGRASQVPVSARRCRALNAREAGIFQSRHYDFRSVWSEDTVGGRDEF